MLRLILMRHAKSDWTMDGTDHDRPLNARGARSALALGDWLRGNACLPDHVLCSSALRTRQTLEGLAIEATRSFDPALYLASAQVMLGLLRDAPRGNILMIGHNPGIAELAARLVSKAPDHPRFDDYPTGSTLVIGIDVETWDGVEAGKGKVQGFVTARDLTG